jgi:hypothetical protein
MGSKTEKTPATGRERISEVAPDTNFFLKARVRDVVWSTPGTEIIKVTTYYGKQNDDGLVERVYYFVNQPEADKLVKLISKRDKLAKAAKNNYPKYLHNFL